MSRILIVVCMVFVLLAVAIEALSELNERSVIASQKCTPIETATPYIPPRQIVCEDGSVHDQ